MSEQNEGMASLLLTAADILSKAGITVSIEDQAQTQFQPYTGEIASIIDHTLLKPQATEEDIVRLCEEAKRYHFASVCISPSYLPVAAELLQLTDVRLCTVIGFPNGAHTIAVKAFETDNAITLGAAEVDMVLNVGWLKSKKYHEVLQDMRQVVAAAERRALVKVILETVLLSDLEKVVACLLAKEAGANFVKTSTGFSTGGATVDDIRLMRFSVGATLGVKASGGIRNSDDARKMIAAGATRLGASASIAIVTGATGGTQGY